jgi:hypothetical protein
VRGHRVYYYNFPPTNLTTTVLQFNLSVVWSQQRPCQRGWSSAYHEKAGFWSLAGPCDICGGWTGTGTAVSPRTWDSSCNIITLTIYIHSLINLRNCQRHKITKYSITRLFGNWNCISPQVRTNTHQNSNLSKMPLSENNMKYWNKRRGTRWSSGWGTALQTGRSWVRFPMVSLDFFIDIILPVAL